MNLILRRLVYDCCRLKEFGGSLQLTEDRKFSIKDFFSKWTKSAVY